MAKSGQVSLVLIGRAVESLRQSDFDTCSAIGEVVDNALQAGASAVHILAKATELPARGRRQAGVHTLSEIAFGDDGCGMDADTLHRCMQLGYSTRYNDRTGIGRFGVGMTLAAINQCKRIEVYSRTASKYPWLYTYVDIDEAGDNPNIPKPDEAALPEEYKVLVGERGTLVVWKKVDKRTSTPEEITHWLARTYRKFIGTQIAEGGKVAKNDSPISVTYNHEPVLAFDPLYAVRSPVFPEGAVATLYDEISLEMPIPEEAGAKAKTGRVVIRMSLTPEHWRLEGGGKAGRSDVAQRLKIGDNEGFSVLRANREVFYDVMPHFEPKVHADGFDRWWSAEIAFEPVLDHYFSVRNIKRGARFMRELREKVEEHMRPAIREARRNVEDTFKRARASATHEDRDVSTEHTEAEQAVKSAAPTPGKAGANKTEDAKRKEIEDILSPLIQEAADLAAWTAKIESQPSTIVDNEGNRWKGTTFLDIHPQGGRTIIEYNMGHEFFLYVYGVIKDLEAGRDDADATVERAKALKVAIDLLFMAYAQAEAVSDPDHSQRIGDTLEVLRTNWGTFLRQFVREFESND